MDNSTKICCALALIAIVLSLYSIFTREKYTAGSVYSATGDGVITVDSAGNLSVNSLTQVQTNQDNISTLDGKVNAFKDIGLVDSFTVANNSTVPTSLAVANYAATTAQGTKADDAETFLSAYFNNQNNNHTNATLNTISVPLDELVDGATDTTRDLIKLDTDGATLNANGGFVNISNSEECTDGWGVNINGGNYRRVRIQIPCSSFNATTCHVEWSVNYSYDDEGCELTGSNCRPYQLSHAVMTSGSNIFWWISSGNGTDYLQWPAMRILLRVIPSDGNAIG